MNKKKNFQDIAEQNAFFKKNYSTMYYHEYIFAEKEELKCNYFEIKIPKMMDESIYWEYCNYFIELEYNQEINDYYRLPEWAKELLKKAEDTLFERDKIRRIFRRYT